MKIHQRVLLGVWMMFIALLPISAATYKGTITIKVGETKTVNIGSGYMGTDIITSGYWDKSNSTFIIKSVSGMYHKECTIEGNKVGSGKLYWDGYIFGDAWDFYWDVTVVASTPSLTLSANPAGGTVEKGSWVQLTASNDEAIIYYTTDGSNPKTSSTWSWPTSKGVQINKSCTLKAFAWHMSTGAESDVMTWTFTCKQSDVVVAEINSTNFPDASFRSWLLSQSYGADGKLTESEIKNITSIDVSGSYSSPGTIKSLKGIEYFTALKSLCCQYNQLMVLDVSKLTALTSLSCYNNQLTTLDVSKLTALTYLYCYDNLLTALDVSRNTELKALSCENNQLTALDVSKLTALTDLNCQNNQLTSLDVSKLTALTDLNCLNNQLTALDVSNLKALTSLYCYNNQLTALDVSKLTALKILLCYNNQLTSLDVSKLTALTYLSCGGNHLTSLDVSKLTALTSLSCGSNQLTALDVSKLTALTSLYCHNNQLTALDVSKLTALKTLYCYKNYIKGNDMDVLIKSLPTNTSNELHGIVVVAKYAENGNVCTKRQAAAIKAKGWTPQYWSNSPFEYEGSDDVTGIKGVAVDTIEQDAIIYNLSGQRLDKPRKGINIIGGKKVMVK